MRSLVLVVALTLWATAAAAADDEPSIRGPARIRMPTGSLLFGVVTELVPGQYVVVLLPHGESRTIPWAAFDMVHVRGFQPLGKGAPLPDTRSYEERTVPASFPPSTDVAPKPAHSETEWALGARGTVITPTSTRGGLALGLGGEANLVHWLAPRLAVYSLVEHIRFNPTDAPSGTNKTLMFGAGFRMSGAATGTSALLDVATGYRVLFTDGDSRSWFRRGAIPLRLGAGLRFRGSDTGEIDLLLHVAPHLYPYGNTSPCYTTCGARTPAPTGYIGISLGMNLHV